MIHSPVPSRRPRARFGIQSVEVGARLLQALTRTDAPMMLRDLAAAAAMPAAKAHRYLTSFMRSGLVEQLPESGHYDLGPFALDLGLSALARLEPITLASRALPGLRDELGQTVALAVWGNHGATIVRWLGANTPVSASLRVGAIMPLTRSATGGAFVAFMPAGVTRRLVAAELIANRRQRLAPRSRSAFDRWVKTAQRAGVARTRHFIPGISGVAVPVYGQNRTVECVVVGLGYSATFNLSLRGAAVRRLKRYAQELSARLRYKR